MARKKSWVEKRAVNTAPHVVELEKAFAGIPAGSKLLVSSPQELDALIRKIPAGKVVDPKQLRATLAKKHLADATCPVSTGIFLRIVAEAALEELAAGKPAAEITPFWRVITPELPVYKKLTASAELIEELRNEYA